MPTKKNSNEGLLARPVPKIISGQIDKFARGLMRDEPVMTLDPTSLIKRLEGTQDQEVIGVDIGGDKFFQQKYKVQTARLQAVGKHTLIKDDAGAGYLGCLEKIAETREQTPVGISIGIPLLGTKTKPGNKLQSLRNDLKKYGNDFAQLFDDRFTCLNDGPAGTIGSVLHAEFRNSKKIDNLIFIINGGGIGASVFTKNTIYTTEAGKVPVIDNLLRYEDKRDFSKFNQNKPCIELVAGNKLGIEYHWQQKTNQKLNAIEIEKQFTENKSNGDFALELYDYSAELIAHVAQGLARAFDIDITSPNTVVVGHGGAFKFPGYGDRVKQILKKHNNSDIQMLLAKDFSDNACAEGVAIAAVAEA